ncbi:MAG: phage integrase SAM-like domain-containing protein [Bacteroidetes bacterium]|nr:phage integrase SAM-like domain-containing protein [Bacteroidota bacterium]
MSTLKLTLDTRREKQNKTYPLIFRLSVNGESRDIKTGHSIPESCWNWKSGSIKRSFPAHDVISGKIKEIELRYLGKIWEYEKNRTRLNAQELRDYILSDHKTSITVYDFWQEEINLIQKADRNGGARIYMESLVALQKIQNLNVPFERIDYKFLKEIEAELISSGVKINSISLYLRTLRAVYNKAVNTEVVSYENYPFRRFRIRKEQTVPHPISLEELQKYFYLQIEKDSCLYDSWLMGKLMFMLIGINFKDMILMKEFDISTGRLIFSRCKTGRIYSIKLLPEALEIIKHFHGRSDTTLLSRVSKAEIEDKIRFPLVVKQKNKLFNEHLSKIGRIIGCKERLRGYVFRYSWANIAKQLDYSTEKIGQALGHSRNSVTDGYLSDYNSEVIDSMNEHICNQVMKIKQEI